MKTYPTLGQTLAPWVLLTALTPAVLYGIEAVELELDVGLTWSEAPQTPGPRCFTVQVPEPGFLWIELTTTAPSTAPEILAFGPAGVGEGGVPETVQRSESVLLGVSQPGEQLICLTSQTPLGRVELVASFVGDQIPTKGGDEDETELEPDP